MNKKLGTFEIPYPVAALDSNYNGWTSTATAVIYLKEMGLKGRQFVVEEDGKASLFIYQGGDTFSKVAYRGTTLGDYGITDAINTTHPANAITTADVAFLQGDGVNSSHIHSNMKVLNDTTASFTTALKTKLDGLNNYTLTSANIISTLGYIPMATTHAANGVTTTLVGNWNTSYAEVVALKTVVEDLEEGILTENITTDLPLGNITTNQSLAEGLSFTEFVKLMTTKTFYPTFVLPTFSLTHNAGTREIGSSFSLVLTSSFNRGSINILNGNGDNTVQNSRSGAATKYTINGVDNGTTNALTISNHVLAASKSFSATVNYSVGPQPKDSKGVNYDTPLAAGSLTASTTVTGYLRRFSGSMSSVPANGAAIRTALLASSVLNTGNSFTMNTGTTDKVFVIAVPSAKTLSSVKNTGTNENLTFTLSTTITTIPDAAGTNQTYKVYILSNAIPFSVDYTLQITLA